jgi:hypothetical protein
MVLKEKSKNNYIFGDLLGKAMSKIDLRTQLEASMMSMSLMAFGLIITMTYLITYMDFPTWYKITLAINGLAGIVFMWSFLITTFQQYKSYMEVIEFQKQEKQSLENDLKGGMQ